MKKQNKDSIRSNTNTLTMAKNNISITRKQPQNNHNLNMQNPTINYPIGTNKSKHNDQIILENYDEYYDSNHDGQHAKQFVLIKTKNVLSDLITTLQRSDSSYCTYANELIKSGYTPKYLSVMKSTNSFTKQEFATKDVFISRLFNYLRIPTVYYFNTIEQLPNTSILNPNWKTNTISIDFISNNEEFSTFYEQNEFPDDTIESWLTSIDRIIEKHFATRPYPMYSLSEIRDTKENLERQFVETYLVRKLLINDTDFSHHNFGILINKQTQNISLAPNFDLEYGLNKLNINSLLYSVPENMKFIYERYPDLIMSFMEKSRNLITPDNSNQSPLDKLLNQGDYSEKMKNETIEIINYNMQTLEKAYRTTRQQSLYM